MKRHSLKILKNSLFAITKKRVREGLSRLNGGKDTGIMKSARLLTALAAATLALLAACGGGGSSTPVPVVDQIKTAQAALVIKEGASVAIATGASSTIVSVACTPTNIAATAVTVTVKTDTGTSSTSCTAAGTPVTVTGPSTVTVTPTSAGAAIGTAVTTNVTCTGTWDAATGICKAVVALKYARAQASYVYAAYNGYAPTQVVTAADGSKKMVATQNATIYNAGAFPIANCKVLLAPLPKTGRIANRCTVADDKMEREFTVDPTTNKLTVYDGTDGTLPVATSPLWLATSEANNSDPLIGAWMDDDSSITYVTRSESRVMLTKNKSTSIVTSVTYPVGITTPAGFSGLRGMWSFSN